ncbi:MAG: GAF domain-containing protein [Desulfobacterales bacterium]|nr:GAF domain-containing protein [Desulfobacterales bacterium]
MDKRNKKHSLAAQDQAPDQPDTVSRVHQLELLLNISKQIAAFEVLDDMLVTLVEITTRELGADRGTIFLNDKDTNELYSRFAMGNINREIRILNDSGVAGQVYTTGQSMLVDDAYTNVHFNKSIDKKTGYVTETILCVPIKTVKGEIIGVTQMLNKHRGKFTENDRQLLEEMTSQAAISLQHNQIVEQMDRSRLQEMEFFDVVSNVTSEIDLGVLLQKVMAEATRMLNADRSTLFLNDEKSGELFSKIGEGLGTTEIRFPNHMGIAGAVFTNGKTIKIPYAYADLRFNPAFDKQTGYFTRSILCVPVINKHGRTIGVTQALNKRGGPFTDGDEARLKAFTAQVSMALENATLFEDVQNKKNYIESMLNSMSNGVITLNEEGKIMTCNAAGLGILQVQSEEIIGHSAVDFFTADNTWVMDKINKVESSQASDVTMDAALKLNGETISANLTVLPLVSGENEKLGSMIMLEDISNEKRMKATMSRYMDPSLTDQLLDGEENILGGISDTATVLFSDIRGFTTLTEELGAQSTVSLLNEYFTIMVDCIQQEGGMLDKFIGDSIMAAFGMPVPHGDDEDRAVRAAIAMIKELSAWNTLRQDQGEKPVDIGIGLNTDTVVSGNIGSPKRMDYTMIGDGVNLAARLESACKQYYARILISENTYKKLRGTYYAREIDRVVVKGKTAPVGIYEILDYHTEETFPGMMDVLNYFKHGRDQYRQGNWDQATTAFKEALACNPADKPSQLYIDRCDQLKTHPPDQEWNGVWVLTSK